jgi:hypothetical protein
VKTAWKALAISVLVPALCALPSALLAQAAAGWPQTKPERTSYRETSTHADVIEFLNALQSKAGDRMWVGSIGTTIEGRDVPYVIASRPLITTPAEAKRLRRPVVYVQGNIHAGEVEGKEALQALLRDLIQRTGPSVLDSVVFIAVPIYNADGNERFAPQARNRGAQNGPEMVGTRQNAQGLNLNRDYIKAEAPETRGSLAMFTMWDPDIFVDLHTSNGSYHGYALTYSPSLHPAGELSNATFGAAYARDSLLPIIRQRMRLRYRFETFDYGNYSSEAGRGGAARGAAGRAGAGGGRGGDSAGRGGGAGRAGGGGGGGRGRGAAPDTMPDTWRTYEHVPRFGTNYYALRGRVAILSEAYSHDPFERRVRSTYAFTREVLSLAAEKRASLFALAERSDRNLSTGRLADVPVRARMTTKPIRVPVLHEVVVLSGDTVQTEAGLSRGLRRTGRIKSTVMNVYDRFEPTRTIRAPVAYVVPFLTDTVVKMLRIHGVVVERLQTAWRGAGEAFTIDSLIRGTFEGHPTTRLEGRWTSRDLEAPVGSYVVRTAQPLGVLAIIMLDADSDDGLHTWNILDKWLSVGGEFPVARARAPVNVPAWVVP